MQPRETGNEPGAWHGGQRGRDLARRTERRSHTHLVRAPGAERQEDREKAVFEEIVTTETVLEPMKTKIHIFGSSTSSKKHSI